LSAVALLIVSFVDRSEERDPRRRRRIVIPAAAVIVAFVWHASVANAIVLSASLIGLVFAGLIAGRILVVVGRAQRRSRFLDA
jgi:quinol-cytochrome oxidoreductase complex cytochrome b subunit